MTAQPIESTAIETTAPQHGAEVFVPLASAAEQKKAEPEKKKGFVCGVCGYVLESDTLPPDFICPVCKHGAEVFTPIE